MRVYVSTYKKYAEGNLKGAWLDLEGNDKEGFFEACKTLHADEEDPELMFQDTEDVPGGMISESSIDDEFWDWMELDDDDRELLEVYRDGVDQGGTIEKARDAFMGKNTSEEDWAEEYLEESGVLAGVPESLRYYIDFEAYARDARLGGDVVFVERDFDDVWVFSNN